jgi:hypothetical protein
MIQRIKSQHVAIPSSDLQQASNVLCIFSGYYKLVAQIYEVNRVSMPSTTTLIALHTAGKHILARNLTAFSGRHWANEKASSHGPQSLKPSRSPLTPHSCDPRYASGHNHPLRTPNSEHQTLNTKL